MENQAESSYVKQQSIWWICLEELRPGQVTGGLWYSAEYSTNMIKGWI